MSNVDIDQQTFKNLIILSLVKTVLGAELHAKIIILCLIIEQLNTIPGSIGPEKSIPTNKFFLIGLWSHFLEFKPKSKAYYINMIKNVIWLAKLNSSSKSDLEKYVSKVSHYNSRVPL